MKYIYRIAWRSVSGDIQYSIESEDREATMEYYDGVKDQAGGPSIAEIWVEQRYVSPWKRIT